jgi:hypothetical protein
MKTIMTLAMALLASVAAAAPKGPLQTYLVEPCRLVDTRNEVPIPGASGPLTGLRFYLVQGKCGVSWGAAAVLVNITAIGATVEGHLAPVSSDAARVEGSVIPPTSTLNFAPGRTVANFAIVSLAEITDPTRDADMMLYANVPEGQVHVVIDVVGFLR